MSIIKVSNLTTKYGKNIIHNNISFEVNANEIFAILGGSGSGKTTLLHTLIFLHRPMSGEITILKENIWNIREKDRFQILKNIGVVFQFGALFSSLNVIENICVLLQQYSKYPKHLFEDIAKFWIDTVGLDVSVCYKMPSELSGGMKKRVALARALSIEPKILFLDEPTSGLDPASAGRFDELIASLRDIFGVTIVMITHDLDSIKDVTDRFILLDKGDISFYGSLSQLQKTGGLDGSLFNSSRGRRYLESKYL